MDNNDFTSYPQNVCYAMNQIPKLVVQSDEAMTIIVFQGGDELFRSRYLLDFDGMIKVDISEICASALTCTLPTRDENSHVTSHKAFTISWMTDSYYGSMRFEAHKAKLKSDDPLQTWAETHFLTNQPTEKDTTTESPEWLTYMDTNETLSIVARLYYTNGGHTDIDITQDNIGITTVNVSWARITQIASQSYSFSAMSLKGYYDILMMQDDNVIATQRYIIRPVTGLEHYYIFENALGGFDTLIAKGEKVLQPQTTYNVGRRQDARVLLDDTDDYRSWTQALLFPWRHRNWICELLTGKGKAVRYDPASQETMEIVITGNNINVSDSKRNASASFSYIGAADDDTLNVPDELGETLTISSLRRSQGVTINES